MAELIAVSLDKRAMMSHAVLWLYLTTLALLPWAWFPPFPWLHEHAQWSDAVFAATLVAWATERWRSGRWPRLGLAHVWLAVYFGAALCSYLLSREASPDGAWKLLGIAELCGLAVVTADLAARPGMLRLIARVVLASSLASAGAAIAGLWLFYAGVSTPLIGSYGDLVASPWYARAQGGLSHPNLLASFGIFAAAVISRPEAELPDKLRRLAHAALGVMVALTFSRGILAFGLAAVVRSARTRGRRLAAGLYAAACVVVIVSLSLWNLSLDPTRPLEARLDHSAASSRRQAIMSSLDTLAARPLLGCGPGVSPGQYRGLPFDAHLTPLNMAATLGLPALAAFSLMLVTLWRQRRRPTELALWGGLAGLALDALAQDIEDFRQLWILIGLAAAEARPAAA
jgi:hypothetical protein